jgi:pimeloyl-ACP methyl ester carboxylesterase
MARRSQSATTDAWAASAGVTFADATLPGGMRLRYAERGPKTGPAIVMLHGYSDSWFSFSLLIPRLPADLRVIAVDQRGHGDSDRPATGYGADDFARDVIALMDALKIDRATIVGHSMGSFVARRTAVLAPGRVGALVLLGAGIGTDNEPVRSMKPVIDSLTDPVDRGFLREFQMSTIARPVPAEFVDRAVAESAKLTANVWKQVYAGLIAYKGGEDAIACPTLVLGGDKDATFAVAEQQAVAAAIRGANIVILPGIGNAPHWEDPERVATEIVAFTQNAG